MSSYRKYLNVWIMASILLGAGLGYIQPHFAENIAIFGDIFLRLLKLLIVPIIFFSLLVGILNLSDSANLGRIGLKAIAYYFSTTMLAVITGLLLVNLIQPGAGTEQVLTLPESTTSQEHSFVNVLLNIIPENIIQAAHDGNVLGLIFFVSFLSVALLKAVPKPQLLKFKELSDTVFNALLWMIDVIMLFAPIGIFSLLATLVADFVLNNQLESLGQGIFEYSLTVVLGLVLHGFVTLPIILACVKVNVFKFFRNMLPALGTAFSTASSVATLPLTLDCLERNGVKNRIASFVAPLGSTVNMDGTAIYEAVAVVFIANMYGVDLTLGEQILIFFTATFSAVGAAGTPGAGLVMMIMVLNVVGLPAEGINLVIVVDRFLDMLRTSVNVFGDSIGAKIIDRTERKYD